MIVIPNVRVSLYTLSKSSFIQVRPGRRKNKVKTKPQFMGLLGQHVWPFHMCPFCSFFESNCLHDISMWMFHRYFKIKCQSITLVSLTCPSLVFISSVKSLRIQPITQTRSLALCPLPSSSLLLCQACLQVRSSLSPHPTTPSFAANTPGQSSNILLLVTALAAPPVSLFPCNR